MATPAFALIRGADQWARASYDGAALVDGVVQLAWSEAATSNSGLTAAPAGAGLAMDAHCRLYHSLPEAGSVERILWSAEDPLHPGASPAALELFERAPLPIEGDFSPPAGEAGPLREPRGLAVDEEDRLFIAETRGRCVLVVDLWSRRLLRRVSLPGRPLDLACDGRRVYAALDTPPGLLRFTARGMPQKRSLPPGVTQPSRLALSPDGRLYLLDRAGTAQARIFDAERGAVVLDAAQCAHATDIEFHSSGTGGTLLVVARRPGEDFLRFRLEMGGAAKVAPLTARGYDGLGIVRTPDQRIAYWSANGLRYAVAARLRHASSGRVVSFRLDSGEYQTTWGRLLLDACIPRDTGVRVRCITSDEPPDTGLIAREAPANVASPSSPPHDEQSPPMPAAWMVSAAPQALPLHRRETGPELPWLRRAADDGFETYEAPVYAGPGRYLWVVLELSGNTRTTPRIRALRAEFPAHDYLKRIPRTLASEPGAGFFLQRYLAPLAGALTELDRRASLRHVLLDPAAAPQEVLPWLASFLGLTLDERWSVEARRTAIREAVWLFRFRGTVPGIARFIQIVLGVRPIIIEKFRLRGGAVIGEPAARSSRSVLGAGLRVGGSVGTGGDTPITAEAEDAFETHAHRFTVLLPALLSQEEVDMMADLLDVHRPAHTLYDLCTVGAGMRVGRGLHAGLTSLIGRGSGFSALQVGGSTLGRGAVIGRPQPGTRVGASRLPAGQPRGDTRVG